VHEKLNYVKTAFHHTASKQLKIFFETTRLIQSPHKKEHRIHQIDSARLRSLGCLARTCLWKRRK